MRSRATFRIAPLLAAVVAAAAVACGPAGSERAAPSSAPGALYLESGRSQAGEAVFRRERCGRCHTLFERLPAGGPPALPPPFEPRRIGSRVGPDLALRGHSRSDDWHLAHLYAPGMLLPGSAMPASRHLFTAAPGETVPRPNGEALDLVAFLQALGRSDRDIWAEVRRSEPDIPPPPAVPRDRLLEDGTRLYRKHCVACHGAAGDGRGEAAPLLRFPPRDFVAARYRFRSTPPGSPPTAADLFRSITLGSGSGAAMPSFRQLTSDERWALAARVIEFSPRLRGLPLEPAPELAEDGSISAVTSTAAIEAGRRWWLDLGCAGCHAGDGRGVDRLQGGFDWVDLSGVAVPESGDLRHACGLRGGASAVALARAVRNGVGDAMPAYADALAPPEIAELVAYLLSLQHPVAAGGEGEGTAVGADPQPATGPGTRNRP